MSRNQNLSRIFVAILAAGVYLLAVSSHAHADEETVPAPGGGTVTIYGLRSDLVEPSACMEVKAGWSWAACTKMVMQRYGYVVDQPAIVATVSETSAGRAGQVPDILKHMNHTWIDRNGRYFKARGTVFKVGLAEAVRALAADQPLIIGTHEHAVVLTSITVANNADGTRAIVAATVRDPARDASLIAVRGKRIMTQKEWNTMSFMAHISVAP